MKRYIRSSFFSGHSVSNYYKNGGGKFRYTVSWLSPEGKSCLLGGSNDPDDAAEIAYEQAEEVLTNPWETDERKYLFLQNLEIVDNQTGKLVEDAKLVGDPDLAPTYIVDLIDDMMSGLDAKIRSKKSKSKVNASSYPIPSIQEIAKARRELEAYDPKKVEYVQKCYDDVLNEFNKYYETDEDGELIEYPDSVYGINTNAVKNDYLLGALEDELMTEEEFNHIYFLIETAQSEEAIAYS